MKKGGVDWTLVIIITLVLALIAFLLFTPLFNKIIEAKDAILGLGPK